MDCATTQPLPQQPALDLSRWHCQSCGCSSPNLLVLPSCSHIFCTACVDQWLWTYISQHGGQSRKYPCQVCGVLYQIPPDGLDAFVQNVHVLRLQLELEQLTMTTHMSTSSSEPTQMTTPAQEHQVTHFMNTTDVANANRSPNDIMQDANVACSGEFSSLERSRCALLPFKNYCHMPNHMF